MIIRFGWRSFNIKSFTLDELQIPTDSDEKIEIEVRQRYFHIFFIPVFGLGKEWIFHKGDLQYEVPENIQQHIQQNHRVRTPWYTYTLLIAALIALLVFLYMEFEPKYRSHQKNKKEHIEFVQNVNNRFAAPFTTDDYFILIYTGEFNNCTGCFLKIVRVEGDNFVVAKYPRNYENEDIYTSIKNNQLSVADTFILSKSELMSAVCKKYKDEESLDAFGVDLLHTDTLYRLEGIENMYACNILLGNDRLNYGLEDGRDTLFYARFYINNWGAPAKLVAIKNITGNVQWQDSILPMEIPMECTNIRRDENRVSGTNYPVHTDFKVMLTFKDGTKALKYYMVEYKDETLNMTKVNHKK
ncbi:MAG: hypothetical protein U0U67_09290 [Chitinophagales bacterium]